jgi:hypothetical protein
LLKVAKTLKLGACRCTGHQFSWRFAARATSFVAGLLHRKRYFGMPAASQRPVGGTPLPPVRVGRRRTGFCFSKRDAPAHFYTGAAQSKLACNPSVPSLLLLTGCWSGARTGGSRWRSKFLYPDQSRTGPLSGKAAGWCGARGWCWGPVREVSCLLLAIGLHPVVHRAMLLE